MSVSKTYAEQVEDLRPDFGFTILSDGTVVRGRNPDSYDEELVQYWQKRWKVMKQLGYFDRGENQEQDLKDDKDQLPIMNVNKDNNNDPPPVKDVKGDNNEKPVHKKRSNHKKNRKNNKK